ncbi:MAG: hypothetical protein NVS1B1_10190 [Candidatus Limnocylindrales bacterium]
MKLFDRVTKISGSAHTGRALKAAKVLNLIGTVRGAVMTVLLASSAIGGAVTVNNVRQEIVEKQPAATQAAKAVARTPPPPPPTPLTATGLRADADKRLQTGLAAAARAAEDLRKVTVLSATAIDTLVLQTRQKLQARYELAMRQIDELVKPAVEASPAPATPAPSAGLSIVAVNALVQLALGDMNGIVYAATRQATTDTPTALTTHPTAVPTSVPTIAPTPLSTILRTPTPTATLPPRTPAPTLRPSPSPSPTR